MRQRGLLALALIMATAGAPVWAFAHGEAGKDKLYVLEFTVESDAEEREVLLPIFRSRLEQHLSVSDSVTLEYVEYATWKRSEASLERFFAEFGVRYVVRGTIKPTAPNRLSIEVTVTDRAGSAKATVYRLQREVTRNLDMLVIFANRLSLDIREAVEGRSVRPTVFTYCFAIIPSNNRELREELGRLPILLAWELRQEKLAERYAVMTFEDEQVMNRECAPDMLSSLNVAFSDYIIRGTIRKGTDPQRTITANIDVEVTGKRPVTLPPRTNKESERSSLIRMLAKHIATEWDRKIKERP
jgi:hypothetical protein